MQRKQFGYNGNLRGLLLRIGVPVVMAAGLVATGVAVSHASTPGVEATEVQVPEVTLASDTVAAAKPVSKVLFIGDSMTGWMAERLNAYGTANDFEVATVVWDGSTITKWGSNAKRLQELVEEINPDAVFISLGLNELFERNPSRLSSSVDAVEKAVGQRDLLWIGPPSWPGHKDGAALVGFLKSHLGKERYFDSFNLDIPRQSNTNPHPTRQGIVEWMDAVAGWIPDNTGLRFRSLDRPAGPEMSRGKTFIYRRMKDSL